MEEENKVNEVVSEPKKKKKGKKVFLLLFILLLVAASVCTWFMMNNNDSNSDDKKDKTKTEVKEAKKDKKKETKKEEKKEEDKKESTDNIIYFYNTNTGIKLTKDYDSIEDKTTIISKYMCDGSCNEYVTENFNPGIMINKKVFIDDTDKLVLFDIDAGNVIGEYGHKVYWLHDQNEAYASDGGRYILINNKEDNAFGVIDKNGGIIHEFNIGVAKRGGLNNKYPMYTTYYSIESNYIVDYKNNKYGVVKLTSNDIVIDYIYDDIKLLGNGYYKVKENDKWYLYSFDTKKKVLNDGYDFVFGVFSDYIVVLDNQKIYIKDFNGNDMLDEPIENTAKNIIDSAEVCCGNTPGVKVEYAKNNITISVYKDNSSEAIIYNFDVATKTLKY